MVIVFLFSSLVMGVAKPSRILQPVVLNTIRTYPSLLPLGVILKQQLEGPFTSPRSKNS